MFAGKLARTLTYFMVLILAFPLNFKGGKQRNRDRNFGISDNNFWDWWHRMGKREQGGTDIATPQQAKDIYEEWVDLGKPNAPKTTRRAK